MTSKSCCPMRSVSQQSTSAKLPADERSAILGALAALAEDLYRGDRQLTDFEAFGEEDLNSSLQQGK